MCGIVGCNAPDIACSQEILDSLYLRGPDASGSVKLPEGFLGHTRLSIIDPHPEANQPMRRGRFTISFNGEIYNYRDLNQRFSLPVETTSDTETLLLLYDKLGPAMVEYLDGMFALAIYDHESGHFFLARDSAGEKPLYYANRPDGKILFASRIDTLLHMGVPLRLSAQAVWDYLTFLWVPEPDTMIEGIKALPRGHTMRIEESGITIAPFTPKISYDLPEDPVESARTLVEQAIDSRLVSDVPVGAFLSGGIDSSLIVALASARSPNLRTFTVGFENADKFSDTYLDERAAARELAQKCRTDHHEIVLDEATFFRCFDEMLHACDQPYAASSGIGILAVSRYASEMGIKVLLSGEGADECFGGYAWYPKLVNEPPGGYPDGKPKGWHWYATEREKKNLLAPSLGEQMGSSLRLLPASTTPKGYIDHDREFYLPNEMMVKTDRMGMRHSVECRSPFVSASLLAFARTQSYETLLHGGETKSLLKLAFSDTLPASVLKRKKQGFNLPVDDWMRKRLQDTYRQLFDPQSRLQATGILPMMEIQQWGSLQAGFSSHVTFALLVLEHWLRRHPTIGLP